MSMRERRLVARSSASFWANHCMYSSLSLWAVEITLGLWTGESSK